MTSVVLYTDGACKGNPGRGGWGAVAITSDADATVLWRISGSDPHTTNNRMELMGAIQALKKVASTSKPLPASIICRTDSTYVSKGITEWLPTWIRKGWKTSTGAPVKNEDLWKELAASAEALRPYLTWKWVKGHSTNPWNNEADRLASEAAASAAHKNTNPSHLHTKPSSAPIPSPIPPSRLPDKPAALKQLTLNRFFHPTT